MVKVTIMYPNGEGSRFDMDYYCNLHMPLVASKLGVALKSLHVEQGIAGAEPGSKPPYLAIGHLAFDSLESYQNAFAAHGADIVADIPNYTNIKPVIQVSEAKM